MVSRETLEWLKEGFSAEKKNDPVNHPSHYCKGGVECIDAIKAATCDLVGIEAFCTGNSIKYLYRWKDKNGTEDLKKARWYLDRLIEEEELMKQKVEPLNKVKKGAFVCDKNGHPIIYAVTITDYGTPGDYGQYVNIGGAFRTYDAAKKYADMKRREYRNDRVDVGIIDMPVDYSKAEEQFLGGWME